MSKDALSLEGVMNYIIARWSKIEVLMGEVILEKKRLVIWVYLWSWHHRFLLHLDAQYLCFSHCQLHLQLRHLVLQKRYGTNTAIYWVSHSGVCFINQTAHCICPLMHRKLLHHHETYKVKRGSNPTNFFLILSVNQLVSGAELCWDPFPSDSRIYCFYDMALLGLSFISRVSPKGKSRFCH